MGPKYLNIEEMIANLFYSNRKVAALVN